MMLVLQSIMIVKLNACVIACIAWIYPLQPKVILHILCASVPYDNISSLIPTWNFGFDKHGGPKRASQPTRGLSLGGTYEHFYNEF
jgi:hypothetical protein